MRYIWLVFISVFSMTSVAQSWYGFCIVPTSEGRICNEPQPRIGDFSRICNAFAKQEGATSWLAQYSTSIEHLKSMLPEYCDIVRDDSDSSMYGCLAENYCKDTGYETISLYSKVYAKDEQKAIETCFNEESVAYSKIFKDKSKLGCFTKITVSKI